MPRNTHAENLGFHIADIVARTVCLKHDRAEGMPCWNIITDTSVRILPAICGSRVKKAGYIGEISSASIQGKPAHDKKRPTNGYKGNRSRQDA